MDDEVVGGWRIDPETRAALRLDRVRRALDEGDPAGAVIEAEELLDEQPEHADALFLLGEALLELGDAEGAQAAYTQHLKLAGPQAGALAGLAISRFEVCDMTGAVEAAREAVRLAPDLAEAHCYLGLALERLPRRRGEALTHFVAANRLDPEAYPFPLELPEATWQEALAQALDSLSFALRAFWEGVPMRFEDLPSLDELRQSDPPLTPTVSGLYVGTPPEDPDPSRIRPEAMRLFRGNLARLPDVDAVITEIAQVLEHEAMDWMGDPESQGPL